MTAPTDDPRAQAERALRRKLRAALPAMRRFAEAHGAGDLQAAVVLLSGDADRAAPALIVAEGKAEAADSLTACMGEALIFAHAAARVLAAGGNRAAERLLTALEAAMDDNDLPKLPAHPPAPGVH